jgi:glycosyltransferase involved in cell wall biosynthesis
MRVHAHFGTNSTDVAMLAQALGGPPFSFTMHGTGELDRLPYLGLEEKVRRAELVISPSLFMKSQIFRSVPHEQWAKVHVVRCGLERVFHEVGEFPVPAAPRLVCIGRLSGEKGQLLLVEAAHSLLSKGVELELVLAGDGPLRGALEELIARHGLKGRVRITGWVSSTRVREEILAARALVLPSFSEGLPVVIMEAMALGRPVIATAVGGVAELVRPARDGWVVPPGSVPVLAQAMQELLATPLEELREMGHAARKRVLERHSIDLESQKLARLFQPLRT